MRSAVIQGTSVSGEAGWASQTHVATQQEQLSRGMMPPREAMGIYAGTDGAASV